MAKLIILSAGEIKIITALILGAKEGIQMSRMLHRIMCGENMMNGEKGCSHEKDFDERKATLDNLMKKVNL